MMDLKQTTQTPSIDDVAGLLCEADSLVARALALLALATRSGAIASATSLPEETALRLIGRRTHWDARELAAACDVLAQMPALEAALSSGALSWSQVRAIVREVRDLDAAGKAGVDALIARRARELATCEPEQIVYEVQERVARLRADRERAREERSIERSFCVLQPHLGGGGSIYAEADAVGFATIAEALDAAAARPVNADEADETTCRARQRLDALVGICAESLAGGGNAGASARPLVYATVELSELDGGLSQAARLLTSVAGRPPRLSPIGTRTLVCDADILPILFEHGRPITVGDIIEAVSAKVRAAVIARDGGCRFPGCGAPASWCEIHHIDGRRGDAAHDPENLVLLCRRCHRRVHRRGWKIALRPDGMVCVSRLGRTFTSAPRARAPSRQ
jgi:hypothetical protein